MSQFDVFIESSRGAFTENPYGTRNDPTVPPETGRILLWVDESQSIWEFLYNVYNAKGWKVDRNAQWKGDLRLYHLILWRIPWEDGNLPLFFEQLKAGNFTGRILAFAEGAHIKVRRFFEKHALEDLFGMSYGPTAASPLPTPNRSYPVDHPIVRRQNGVWGDWLSEVFDGESLARGKWDPEKWPEFVWLAHRTTQNPRGETISWLLAGSDNLLGSVGKQRSMPWERNRALMEDLYLAPL